MTDIQEQGNNVDTGAWASDDVKRKPREELRIRFHKDGSIEGWCADMRILTGRCPDGFERECEDCFCG